ncbi:hypothetical protein SLEP1_g22245 [Rubroshorea leprosula]|uniref:Uncharacterized protein n=1 Tax=Rubroshorea leprosula TaxID=152421 RepID=A0AAV5JBM0_9ROSI|nr:hypothetical protein SLEP1_g22245 [Rubroshorea leprosula]
MVLIHLKCLEFLNSLHVIYLQGEISKIMVNALRF